MNSRRREPKKFRRKRTDRRDAEKVMTWRVPSPPLKVASNA